jgi:hypothetical protein
MYISETLKRIGMETIKSYTDLEQSKKLTNILPLESADMYYCYGMDVHTKKWEYDTTPTIIDTSNQIDIGDIPCWSLAALMDVLPILDNRSPVIPKIFDRKYRVVYHSTSYERGIFTHDYDNPVDACYELILKLHELNLL